MDQPNDVNRLRTELTTCSVGPIVPPAEVAHPANYFTFFRLLTSDARGCVRAGRPLSSEQASRCLCG